MRCFMWTKIKTTIQTLDRFERRFCFIVAVLAVFILLGACFYALFGHFIIESMYHGRSLPFLNHLIQYQDTKPLEHYLQTGDVVFYKLFTVSLIGVLITGGMIFVLYRLIFSSGTLQAGWVVFLCMLMLGYVFYLNPQFRILSNHGFLRASLVYQILNGNVPPEDPFFDGCVFRWPWGYAWLSACVCRGLNITPFYASALLNIIALGLCLWLLYKLSELLVQNPKTNLFSSLIAMFGITVFSTPMIFKIAEWIHPALGEIKATPVFAKFTNFSGVPLGLFFYLLFLYSAICLFKKKNPPLALAGVLSGLLGGGFIYIAFWPGLVLAVGVFCLAPLIPCVRRNTSSPWCSAGLIGGGFVLSAVILESYFSLLYSGIGSTAEFFNPVYILKNVSITLFLTGPILLIVGLLRRCLIGKTDPLVLLFLGMIILVTVGAYWGIHFPHDVEYKFLYLFCVLLGILAGPVFHRLAERIPKPLFLILLGMFLFPSISDTWAKLRRYGNNPEQFLSNHYGYVERGTTLQTTNLEEQELYDWIIQHTPVGTVFIDTKWTIPVLAQRQLYFGLDQAAGGRISGYGINMEFLKQSQLYEEQHYQFRHELVCNIYGIEQTLPRSVVLQTAFDENLYVVLRGNDDSVIQFETGGLEKLFTSSEGTYCVYRVPFLTDRAD